MRTKHGVHLDWTGLVWSGLDWTGLVSSKLDRTGLVDCIELDLKCPIWAGLHGLGWTDWLGLTKVDWKLLCPEPSFFLDS